MAKSIASRHQIEKHEVLRVPFYEELPFSLLL